MGHFVASFPSCLVNWSVLLSLLLYCYSLDQRLLAFYALLFNWMHELAYEFPAVFDRDATLEWVNGTLTSELKHYYALDDSSKTGNDQASLFINFLKKTKNLGSYEAHFLIKMFVCNTEAHANLLSYD